MRYIITLIGASLFAAPAAAEVPRVVTDIGPVHSLVAQVMGDLGEPQLLLERGADPHSFQLRPSQAADVAAAQLVVWIGPEMTPWLDRALDSLSADAPQLALLGANGSMTLAYAEGDDHDHDHEEEAEPEGTEEHARNHSGADPHAWLDPGNAVVWLDLIASELSRIDPANAATYAANAKTAITGVQALDTDLQAQLAPLQSRPFVVFHDAYRYFTGHYGLTVAGTLAFGDAAAPGAERLSELRSSLESGNAICIFPEAAHDPKQVALMAEGTDVRIGNALEPEGSTLTPGPALYDTLMRGLAQTLTDCLTATN